MTLVKALCLSLFMIGLAARGQETAPLREVLAQIEQAHGVSFSFIEDEIVVYRVIPPQRQWTLAQKLSHLENETRLRFKKIGDGYYSIFNDKRMDKPLCGYLLDAQTGTPVENAAILVAGGVVASSDSNGYFELPALTPETVSVRHQSYLSLAINPEDLYVAQCPKLLLVPVVQELDDVSAKPYIATGIGKTAEGTFTVRPPKFGILPGLAEPDVLQAMQQLPGIYSADETVSNLNVRGGTHDQNLFLWNGIRMFQTGHFFGLISGFNPSAVRRVEIVKSGSSAFFGESVSSVVDISSRDRSLESGYGASLNMISGEFFTRTKFSNKTALMLSGRRSYTDFIETVTYREYRDRVFQNTVVTDPGGTVTLPATEEDFYFYDLAAQFEAVVGRHTVTADAIAMQNELSLLQDTRSNSLAQRHYGAGVNIRSAWTNKTETTIAASASNYQLKSAYLAAGGQTLDQRNEVFFSALRAQSLHRLSAATTLETGYQLEQSAVTNFDQVNTPFFSRTVKEVLISHSVIGEIRYAPDARASVLRAGIRTTYIPKFEMLLAEPRISLRQRIAEAWHLEISAERKSQTLSQVIDLQRDFLGIEKRRWVMANQEDLPVQTSWQGTAGLSFIKNDWLATAEVFYKLIDGITSSEQGFQNQFEFLRASGAYTVYGAETLLQKRIGRINSWVSYAYTQNDYKFDPFQPRIFPNYFGFRHSVSAAALYEHRGLRFALGGKWNSGRPYTGVRSLLPDTSIPGNPRVDFGVPNAQTLPQYVQVNASASKEWNLNKARLAVSAAVLNIFGHNNTLSRFYRIDPSGTNVETVDTYGLGATPNVSVRVIF